VVGHPFARRRREVGAIDVVAVAVGRRRAVSRIEAAVALALVVRIIDTLCNIVEFLIASCENRERFIGVVDGGVSRGLSRGQRIIGVGGGRLRRGLGHQQLAGEAGQEDQEKMERHRVPAHASSTTAAPAVAEGKFVKSDWTVQYTGVRHCAERKTKPSSIGIFQESGRSKHVACFWR